MLRGVCWGFLTSYRGVPEGCCGRLVPVGRIVAVVVVAVCCLVSCASGPLSGCSKEADGSLDCSLQDLSRADLQGANLRAADLYGADLEGANLRAANLEGADLERADLYGADLYGADLERAVLFGADLEGADLRGADLQGADLYGADLGGAKANQDTIWRKGFDPVAAGVIFE